METTSLKIAYIGGGSRNWAPKLMADLALCPELSGEVALYDIDPVAAGLNQKLGSWLQGQPGVVSSWRYYTAATLEAALQAADFVVISIQPGPLEVMAEEIAIAEEYDLYYPVGDTTGAPGLVRGLRAATIYAGFAQAIAQTCPSAWVINYTNPMAICTRTLTRVAPGLKVFGCCHEVFATQRMLSGLASQYLGIDPAPAISEIQVNVSGINHFTWIDRADYQGHDLLALLRHHLAQPGVLRTFTREEVESRDDWFYSADQVKLALFQRYGWLAAAGDRHLVEFLPGFIRSPELLFQWGIIRTPVTWRLERWAAYPKTVSDLIAGRSPLNLQASGEEGVALILALVGLGDRVTNVNLENLGQVANLPLGVVVETNARFSRDRIQPLAAGALPPGLAPLIALHSANQELIIDASLACDREMAFQAVYNDPSSHLTIDQAWEMFNRMLALNQPYLPAWKFDYP